MIVNWRTLAGLPTEHQHLNEFILHHPVTRIVALFEAQVWLHFVVADFGALDQFINCGERRNGTKRVQSVGKIGERKMSAGVRRVFSVLKLSCHSISCVGCVYMLPWRGESRRARVLFVPAWIPQPYQGDPCMESRVA